MMRAILMSLVLVGCGESSSNMSTQSALKELCSTNCAKSMQCQMSNDPQCQSKCEAAYGNFGYNDTVLRGIRDCLDQTACNASSDQCIDGVFTSLPKRPVDDAYDRACLTRQSECPAMSVECGKDTRSFSETFIKDRLQPCLSVPCDQIESCEGALFG
jgi:hypothetical protein